MINCSELEYCKLLEFRYNILSKGNIVDKITNKLLKNSNILKFSNVLLNYIFQKAPEKRNFL